MSNVKPRTVQLNQLNRPNLNSISESCIQQTAYRWANTDGEFFGGKAQKGGQGNDSDERKDKDECRREVGEMLHMRNEFSKGFVSQ